MFHYKNVHISLMGVINITPDSFSDGGEFNTSDRFLEQANHFINNHADILDIGAESSAPMNQAISCDEEILRFKEIVLPVISQIKEEVNLSIDTYKLETIKFLLNQEGFQRFYNANKLIWNDVSGKIDDANDLLKNYPELSYVHCHNLVPKRSQTLEHMDNLCEDLDLETYFKSSQHILDPCFGFSKKREQNYEIWKMLPDLISKFHKNSWMIGISRKSFLRFLDLDKGHPVLIAQTDIIQSIMLKELIISLSKLPGEFNLIFRMHDPYVFHSIKSSFTFN